MPVASEIRIARVIGKQEDDVWLIDRVIGSFQRGQGCQHNSEEQPVRVFHGTLFLMRS
jgi:hypothetical protein